VTASQPLFTFRQIPVVASMLAERQIALAEVMRAAGFAEPAPGEITAPLAKVRGVLELAAERLGASHFGFDLADRIPEGAYGVTEFVVRSAPTVRAALTALCELAPLVNPALDMRYQAQPHGCEVRLAYAGTRDVLGELLNEYSIAYVAKQFRAVLGGPLPLASAWFAHARKHGREEVERRLGCAVAFGAADCGFAVASDVIARAIPSANPPLHAYLIAQARAQLANLAPHDVIAQVTRAIEARLAGGDLSAAAIARALETSQRSLQRQLAEAGTSYRDVVASVRRRRRDELARAGLAEAEIAARLGFASAKTMRRSLDDEM
jgi:AraC-like DNA-binding protein